MGHLAGSALYAKAAPRAIRAMVNVVIINLRLAWKFWSRQRVPRLRLLLRLNEFFSNGHLACLSNWQHCTVHELNSITSKRTSTTTPTRATTGQRWSYGNSLMSWLHATYPCLGKGCLSLILHIYSPPGFRVKTHTVLPSGALMVAVLSVNSTLMPPSQILPTESKVG